MQSVLWLHKNVYEYVDMLVTASVSANRDKHSEKGRH